MRLSESEKYSLQDDWEQLHQSLAATWIPWINSAGCCTQRGNRRTLYKLPHTHMPPAIRDVVSAFHGGSRFSVIVIMILIVFDYAIYMKLTCVAVCASHMESGNLWFSNHAYNATSIRTIFWNGYGMNTAGREYYFCRRSKIEFISSNVFIIILQPGKIYSRIFLETAYVF